MPTVIGARRIRRLRGLWAPPSESPRAWTHACYRKKRLPLAPRAGLPSGASLRQHQNEKREGLSLAKLLMTLRRPRRLVRSRFGSLRHRQCDGSSVGVELGPVIAGEQSDGRGQDDEQDEREAKIDPHGPQ